MCPSLYKQVYLGALGEVAGKAIIENQLGITLQNITDYSMYEYFDFIYNDIYIDFKHWDNFIVDNDDYVRKCMNKLAKIKGSKCLIINLIKKSNNNKIIQNVSQNTFQVPYLINLEKDEIDSEMLEKLKIIFTK